jgi:hypothetical protein
MSEGIAKLKERMNQAKEYISIQDLPDKVNLVLVGDLDFKADKRGNESCFVTLMTKERKYLVQKYTPSTYKELFNAIEECGGIEALRQKYLVWEKRRSGRAINDRLFPRPEQRSQKS